MQKAGARSSSSIKAVDVIIVFASGPEKKKTIPEGRKPRYRTNNEPMKLHEVYYHYAARVDRQADRLQHRRKCVVQAEWFLRCLREGGRDGNPMADWEIKFVLSIYLPVCVDSQG